MSRSRGKPCLEWEQAVKGSCDKNLTKNILVAILIAVKADTPLQVVMGNNGQGMNMANSPKKRKGLQRILRNHLIFLVVRLGIEPQTY
jgi:hypothetical protein